MVRPGPQIKVTLNVDKRSFFGEDGAVDMTVLNETA